MRAAPPSDKNMEIDVNPQPFKAKNRIRIVTAASLFDGHDAAINIMRRILQASGAEVIHLGHDRSAYDVVQCAIQEDASAIAMTSYQGGHNEYFRYMVDMLHDAGRDDIRIFGGGGGVILPSEILELQAYGVERIYSPDDGRALGLQGMIDDLLQRCDRPLGEPLKPHEIEGIAKGDASSLGRAISVIENHPDVQHAWLRNDVTGVPVLGITGTGGSGKSSLVDELLRRFLHDNETMRIGVISVDPSKRKTGGALLGDRIRMNSLSSPRIYMRSLATRQANLALSAHVPGALCVLKQAGFSFVILETSGIGQSDTEIVDQCDLSLYVMTPEYGAATQLEKIDMLDFADVVALNKCDKNGSADALRDVRKQVQRGRQAFDVSPENMPVFGTIASQFGDPGTDRLYWEIKERLRALGVKDLSRTEPSKLHAESEKIYVIPPKRVRYLADIADCIHAYNTRIEDDAKKVDLIRAYEMCASDGASVGDRSAALEGTLNASSREALASWPDIRHRYNESVVRYSVRGKEVSIDAYGTSLAGTKIHKVALPRHEGGALLRWLMQENLPGFFPYTAGVFPFKRENEDPIRMFAGEGGPERTNRRFHYLASDQPASRLSTAFDSATLYGADPDRRPDIYGKVGNAGVSVCCLDDAKKLYSGFNLLDPNTSVSMTINGPAPTLVAFFMNAAVDQQCELHIQREGLEKQIYQKIKELIGKAPVYHGELPRSHNGLGLMLLGVTGDQVLDREVYDRIQAHTLSNVRGTVQADILKEDQAQNTCIFSTEFSLKVMGDVQASFTARNIRNFYSVSISGYHIAEAGANPITQLAFTLANGFTYVEYYLSRGLSIDSFAPNLSFFFSNGLDPEYVVLGRVARRIWAKAMRERYGASDRSQMLKYHVQTSGRSLHAQEVAFNDIRTTLQAVLAIFDNCNSLHTNAYDEAVTTPTEESVRRAMAIQLVINREFGATQGQNILQGSFWVEELTNVVEEAVLVEFARISERGGVLGAMETMYQRGKIQEESLHYEHMKHSGALPLVGVNMFLGTDGSPTMIPAAVMRSSTEEKEQQIETKEWVQYTHSSYADETLKNLQRVASSGGNVFDELLHTSKFCTLGQITQALFAVGGQYRRNM